MPPAGFGTWPTANTYCTTTTILGQTGWRLPTKDELVSMYNSGAIVGQGAPMLYTWSSTPNGDGSHYLVDLNNGGVLWGFIDDDWFNYVTCVR